VDKQFFVDLTPTQKHAVQQLMEYEWHVRKRLDDYRKAGVTLDLLPHDRSIPDMLTMVCDLLDPKSRFPDLNEPDMGSLIDDVHDEIFDIIYAPTRPTPEAGEELVRKVDAMADEIRSFNEADAREDAEQAPWAPAE